jgi:polar amino acid transport system substrate-binding protein
MLVALGGHASAQTDPIETIRARGELVVGVKTDYPPFGQLNASGEIVGFEPALAAELARRMGVGLRTVSVTSANRLQRLQDGTIDVMIATLGDTVLRRQIATLIEPNYYASGMNIMLRPNTKIHDWTDLRGQEVCATQGVYGNRPLSESYLMSLRVFNSNRDAELALQENRCVGWLQDDTLIVGMLTAPDWAGYSMPLRSLLVLPWAIAINTDARGSKLETFLSNTVADWHRSGFLAATEKAYGMPPSGFVERSRALWNRTGRDGGLVCHREPDGSWPDACRNQSLLTSTEASGLLQIGLEINEKLGINLSLVYDPYDRLMFATGFMHTVLLIVLCIAGGFVVGVAGGVVMTFRVPGLSALVAGILTVSRMTPPLLQMYVIFFGLGHYLAAHGWGTPNASLVVVICLSLYAGAANAFALMEASDVLFARSKDFTLRLSTLPAALHLARGPIIASLVNAVKATGMASAIAVPEIISASTSIMAERGNAGVMMNALMLTYFLLIMLVIAGLDAVQRRLHDA